MRVAYDASRHHAALRQHDRRWQEMRVARREHGLDSDAYREARQHMIEAKRIVQLEARRRARRR